MTKIKIFLSSFLIIIIISSCKQAVTCRDINEKYFSLTEDLKSQSDTLNFIENLDKLIEQNPQCLKAFQARGYFKMNLGDFSSAKKDFLNSLQENINNNVYPYYCLSGLYNMENNNDSALFFIEKAIEIKSRGKYVINSNNYFKQFFDINYGKLIFHRAIINYEMGKLDLALSDFSNAIYHEYDKGEAYSHIATVFWRMKKIDSACHYQNLAQQNFYFEVDKDITEACQLLNVE